MSAVQAMINGHSAPPAGEPANDPVAEKARLEEELAAARRRIEGARQRAGEKDLEARAVLRAELETTRAVLAEIERRHHEAVAELRASTDAVVARLLDEARRATGQVPADDE